MVRVRAARCHRCTPSRGRNGRALRGRQNRRGVTGKIQAGGQSVTEMWRSNMADDLITTETILAQNAEVIRALGKRVVGDIVEIGRRLSESKKVCGHGRWLPWLDREFGWSEQTARNYMALHELVGKSPT